MSCGHQKGKLFNRNDKRRYVFSTGEFATFGEHYCWRSSNTDSWDEFADVAILQTILHFLNLLSVFSFKGFSSNLLSVDTHTHTHTMKNIFFIGLAYSYTEKI